MGLGKKVLIGLFVFGFLKFMWDDLNRNDELSAKEAPSADDRIFTSLFACADHPGNGTNERLVVNLAGVYRTQGLDQLKNVMGGSQYRKYCFLDGSPFPAVALNGQNIVQSWTEWNGEGVYVIKATEGLSFAVVYP